MMRKKIFIFSVFSLFLLTFLLCAKTSRAADVWCGGGASCPANSYCESNTGWCVCTDSAYYCGGGGGGVVHSCGRWGVYPCAVNSIWCGLCSAGTYCDAVRNNGSCQSLATFCSDYGYQCGTLCTEGSPSCANCGSCSTGYTCSGNQCVPTGPTPTPTPVNCSFPSSALSSGSVYTISANCTMGATENLVRGVMDNNATASDASNSAALVVGANRSLTIGAGNNQVLYYGRITLMPGASLIIAKNAGAKLIKGVPWVKDTDGDSYPDSANPSPVINTTSGQRPDSTYVRKNIIDTHISTADCSPSNANVFVTATCYSDGDNDDYGNTGSSTYTCMNNATCGSATWGGVGAGAPSNTNFSTNNTDCNDGSLNVYQTVASTATDADQDGYATGAAGSNCVGSSTSVNGRTYYKNTAGSYAFVLNPLAAAGGSDIKTYSTTNQTQRGVSRAYMEMAYDDNYVYILGGYDGGSTHYANVYKAPITNGNIGAWSTLTSMPAGRSKGEAVLVDKGGQKYIYYIGGENPNLTANTTVYKATLDGSGDITGWTTTTALPEKRRYHTVATLDIGGTDYIYVIGGYNDSAHNATVYMGTVDASGNIGAWSTTTAIPAGISYQASDIANIGGTNYLYLVGGGASGSTTVRKATIAGDGTISGWTSLTAYPASVMKASAQVVGIRAGATTTNYLYVFGGYVGGQVSAVRRALIDASGNIGAWSTTNQDSMPYVNYYHRTVVNNVSNGLYLFQSGGTSVHKATFQGPDDTTALDCDDTSATFYPGHGCLSTN